MLLRGEATQQQLDAAITAVRTLERRVDRKFDDELELVAAVIDAFRDHEPKGK